MTRNLLTRVSLALVLLVLLATTSWAQDDPMRPHDVAVKNGDIVATSLGTNFVRILHDGKATVDSVNVGAPSWDLCFADTLAFITMPDTGLIKVLNFATADTATVYEEGISVPVGCTEIIADEAGETLYVANVGASDEGSEEDSWQHSIIVIDISQWPSSVSNTFSTERQPRALALSPDESRLFVGTIQGALGGTPLIANYSDPTNGFTSTHDGGSVMIHSAPGGIPQYRIAIGSPVRGLAVIDGDDYGSVNGDYRIYLTNVGEGAQSEDPGRGGRAIPNVVSSIRMSSLHSPLERQDAIFHHRPTESAVGTDHNEDLPAVLPEKLAVRPISSRAGYSAELWVTNSASGTVSRAWVDSLTGAIATAGPDTLFVFPAIESVQPPEFGYYFNETAQRYYSKISPKDHIRTDGTSDPFRSRPRGIAYDDANDAIVVCMESLGDVVSLDPSQDPLPTSAPSPILQRHRLPLAQWQPGSPSGGSGGEANFFTFGSGFDFREVQSPNADPVDNISCGTCHPDGHLDGKVRFTVRRPANMENPVGENRMLTAVPSFLDVPHSEWIFFEGTLTLADRESVNEGCTYCDKSEFFLNTLAFKPLTSRTPTAADTSLSQEGELGRAWFDDMNCSRCHSAADTRFTRSRSTGVDDEFGPLVFSNRVLSDPRQSFISSTLSDELSLRNMTNVGTRLDDSTADLPPDSNAIVAGINVPGLAGAWDNRPYLHDGRYRTLDEVLENTWIRKTLGSRSARLWLLDTVPDNLFDDEEHPLEEHYVPDLDPIDGGFIVDGDTLQVKNFQTHQHGDPDGAGTEWVSVKEYLSPKGAYDDLLVFLRSLSSDLDPYPANDSSIGNLLATLTSDSVAVLSWTTTEETISRYEITNDVNAAVLDTIVGPGTTYSFNIPLAVEANWTAIVSTTYNGFSSRDTVTWSNIPLFADRSDSTGFDFAGTPYATIAIDHDGNGHEDMLISDATGSAALMENQLNSPQRDDIPLLKKDDSWFPGVGPPSNIRGITAADYDNDGDPDLFLSSVSGPKLFRSVRDSSKFTDITNSVGGSFPSYADSSWCGAWGDYDRDGRVDLYVGRATGSGSTPTGVLADQLFRNVGDLNFERVTDATELSEIPASATTTASWSDFTGDGELDLFVGGAATSDPSRILKQQLTLDTSQFADPLEETVHSFASVDSVFPDVLSSLDQTAGASWRDLDNDGDLDLAVARYGSGNSGSHVLYWTSADKFDESTSVGGGMAAKGQTLFDSNLDGRADLLLAPATASTSPGFFQNAGASVAQSFDDMTFLAGMESATSPDFRSILAADLAGPSHSRDGDEDIYIGRPESTKDFFYQNAPNGVDVQSNRWLQLSLTSEHFNNRGGVGATVQVETGSLIQTQIVDGGSGVGAQASRILTFGLGNTSSATDVTVTWPDGSTTEKSFTLAELDTLGVIEDDHSPGMDNGSPDAQALAEPGVANTWIFEWETDYITDPSMTQVTIDGGSSRNPDCFYDDFTLDPSQGSVSVQMLAKPGGGYVHRLIVYGKACDCAAEYTYKVLNNVHGGTAVESTAKYFTPPGVCIQ